MENDRRGRGVIVTGGGERLQVNLQKGAAMIIRWRARGAARRSLTGINVFATALPGWPQPGFRVTDASPV